MNKPKTKKQVFKKTFLYILIAIFIVWNIALFFIDKELANNLLQNNNHAYLIFFVIASTTGLSIFAAGTFYTTLVQFTQIGLDPIILGVIGGLGTSIGDFMYLYLARQARDFSNIKKSRTYNKISQYVSRDLCHESCYRVYIFVFLFAAFVPIPNDILMVALGFLSYKYSRIIPLVILGNIVMVSLVAIGALNVF